MNGVVYAVSAGIGFGLFQACNRRANQDADAYRSTFHLLLVGSVVLLMWSVLAEDVGVIATAPVRSLLAFGAAGIVHFSFGWTFLSLSQQQIGAGATGAVLAATPLIAAFLAALLLGEPLTVAALVGVLLVAGGVSILALRKGAKRGRSRVPWYGLAGALSWGISPLLIRWGLEGLDSPLIGVTVGLIAACATYGVALLVRRRYGAPVKRMEREGLKWATIAGVLVAISITFQWIAVDLIAIAVAITLTQLAAPTVIVAAPFIVRAESERPSLALVAGAAAVVSGSVLVVLSGAA